MRKDLFDFIELKAEEAQAETAGLFARFSKELQNGFTYRVADELMEPDDGLYDVDALQSIWLGELKKLR